MFGCDVDGCCCSVYISIITWLLVLDCISSLLLVDSHYTI